MFTNLYELLKQYAVEYKAYVTPVDVVYKSQRIRTVADVLESFRHMQGMRLETTELPEELNMLAEVLPRDVLLVSRSQASGVPLGELEIAGKTKVYLTLPLPKSLQKAKRSAKYEKVGENEYLVSYRNGFPEEEDAELVAIFRWEIIDQPLFVLRKGRTSQEPDYSKASQRMPMRGLFGTLLVMLPNAAQLAMPKGMQQLLTGKYEAQTESEPAEPPQIVLGEHFEPPRIVIALAEQTEELERQTKTLGEIQQQRLQVSYLPVLSFLMATGKTAGWVSNFQELWTKIGLQKLAQEPSPEKTTTGREVWGQQNTEYILGQLASYVGSKLYHRLQNVLRTEKEGQGRYQQVEASLVGDIKQGLANPNFQIFTGVENFVNLIRKQAGQKPEGMSEQEWEARIAHTAYILASSLVSGPQPLSVLVSSQAREDEDAVLRDPFYRLAAGWTQAYQMLLATAHYAPHSRARYVESAQVLPETIQMEVPVYGGPQGAEKPFRAVATFTLNLQGGSPILSGVPVQLEVQLQEVGDWSEVVPHLVVRGRKPKEETVDEEETVEVKSYVAPGLFAGMLPTGKDTPRMEGIEGPQQMPILESLPKEVYRFLYAQAQPLFGSISRTHIASIGQIAYETLLPLVETRIQQQLQGEAKAVRIPYEEPGALKTSPEGLTAAQAWKWIEAAVVGGEENLQQLASKYFVHRISLFTPLGEGRFQVQSLAWRRGKAEQENYPSIEWNEYWRQRSVARTGLGAGRVREAEYPAMEDIYDLHRGIKANVPFFVVEMNTWAAVSAPKEGEEPKKEKMNIAPITKVPPYGLLTWEIQDQPPRLFYAFTEPFVGSKLTVFHPAAPIALQVLATKILKQAST
jgi:hypothetical protein